MNREELLNNVGIIGQSVEMQEILDVIQQVAPTDITVLLTGESGTGKEVFANAIHSLSQRNTKPMVTVNCGAIPEGLIESELFGHEKGSFTSAVDTRKGYFEIADGGTIFLDEVGELPLATQVKFLRVLENGEYMRVGSSLNRKTNVRVIAATNKNLEFEVQQRRFRSDLYFRLRSVNISIPPLRKRKDDIPLLVEHFASEVSTRNNIKFEGFTDDGAEILMKYDWPGNVRELRNVIESIIILGKGKQIGRAELLQYLNGFPLPEVERNLPVLTNKTVEQAERELIYRALVELKTNIIELRELISKNSRNGTIKEKFPVGFDSSMTLDEMEARLIRRALERNSGNKRMTARELNISERTLYRKIKDLGLVT